VLEVDTIVVRGAGVAAQLQAPWPRRSARAPHRRRNFAGELDAKRAIDEGTRLAAAFEKGQSHFVFEACFGRR
jgi:hypothetical protein